MVYVKNFSDGDASSAEKSSTKSFWRTDSNREGNDPYQSSLSELSLEGNTMTGKICIVDHDLSSQGYLRECLEREGHEVITLDSGYQIQSRLSKENFDILMLNVDSPGIKENSLLLQIQKSCRPRILLVISQHEDPFLKEAIDAGVYGFIHMPFNLREVCMMVDHLTRSSM